MIDVIEGYHPPLDFDITLNSKNTLKSREISNKHNFRRGLYEELNLYLDSLDWRAIFDGTGVNQDVKQLYNILYYVIDMFIPLTVNDKNTFPPWFTSNIKFKIFEKKRAHVIYKKTRSQEDYLLFSQLRAECATLIKNSYNNYCNDIENNLSNNPKSFWKYARSLRTDDVIPQSLSLDNETYSNYSDSVNGFATYFRTVFSPTIQQNINHIHNIDPVCNLNSVEISRKDITDGLSNLKVDRSAGPDGIPNIFLVNCASSLDFPLFLIFNKSLSTGVFPMAWKKSKIIPIFKKGSKNLITNYRPISILSAIPKLFEQLVAPCITRAFENAFAPEQHGFVRHKSTVSNLATINHYILSTMDKGGQVDVVYTDFAKAFDKVPHATLLRKLSAYGVSGSLLRWIEAYLTNRKQYVFLYDNKSVEFDVTSGVPQGSHLGPILFNIFINDLPKYIKNCHLLLFADDAKIYTKIDNISSAQLLQNDLNSFENWCIANHMSINVSKCCVTRFTTKREPTIYDYKLCNSSLSVENDIRDLGVIFSSDGTFGNHIQNIVNKSLKILGFINRISANFKEPLTYLRLYNTLVRPTIEYASSIWSPYTLKENKLIESIQNKFLRRLAYLSGMPMQRIDHDYTNVKDKYKIDSLRRRRLFNDLILLYNIINHEINCDYLRQSIYLTTPARNLRDPRIFPTAFYRQSKCANNTVNRICNFGNLVIADRTHFDLPFVSFINLYKRTLVDN